MRLVRPHSVLLILLPILLGQNYGSGISSVGGTEWVVRAAGGGITLEDHDVSVSTASRDECGITLTPSGTPTLVLCALGLEADITPADGGDADSDIATYGGSAMTEIGSSGTTTAPSDVRIYLYELIDPPSGEQSADIDFTSTNNSTCACMLFSGTDTTDPTVEFGGYDNGGNACSAATTTLTMNSTASWMATFGVWETGDQDPFTPTGFTIRGEGDTGAEGSTDLAYDYGDSTGTSGSLSHVSTPQATTDDECGQVSVEIVE